MSTQTNSKLFPPDSHCVICQKTIEEVGGQRIIAQQLRGVALSNQYQGGGNKDFPHQSYKLPESDLYVVIWGSPEMWTKDAVQRAIDSYVSGKHPWFCQVCGNRVCAECDSPLKRPVGSDVLFDDCSTAHVAMLPIPLRCTNPNCSTNMERK